MGALDPGAYVVLLNSSANTSREHQLISITFNCRYICSVLHVCWISPHNIIVYRQFDIGYRRFCVHIFFSNLFFSPSSYQQNVDIQTRINTYVYVVTCEDMWIFRSLCRLPSKCQVCQRTSLFVISLQTSLKQSASLVCPLLTSYAACFPHPTSKAISFMQCYYYLCLKSFPSTVPSATV